MTQPGKTSTTRASRRITATERFKAQAAQGRSRPVLWILLGIGGVFGVVVLVMFLGDHERPEMLKAKLEEMRAAGRRLQSEGKLDLALEKFRAALKYAEDHDALEHERRDIRGDIKGVEREIGNRAERELHIAAFEKDFRRRTPQDLADLRRRGEKLLEVVPSHAALRDMVDTLLREIEEQTRISEEDDFIRTKRKIHGECRLDKQNPLWGKAIGMWREYQARKTVTAHDRGRAGKEIEELEGRARKQFEWLSQRESVEGLRSHRPRFEGAAVAADFDAFLKDRR